MEKTERVSERGRVRKRASERGWRKRARECEVREKERASEREGDKLARGEPIITIGSNLWHQIATKYTDGLAVYAMSLAFPK
ncbi:conserved hypothetical protein [Ricinus communis]|uniref:Uncharacterized protein n=1 Tax=Ricinus communis TaxID=3988 RepID=B9T8N4_RICCO|nr:conserved hypothetical protein [Ricinus communis]